MDKRLFIISLGIFVNVLGVGLVLPLLPFFAENLGASALIIGLFIAVYPLFSILAGPFLGVLSDKYGRKPILLLSVAGTVAGFVLLGVAKTLPLLFLARIIDGASAGNTSTAKAAIADITTKEERVNKLGFTFAAESLGLIMGPVLGGLFSQYGLSVSAYIAASIATVCFFLIIFFFPETKARSTQSVEQKITFDWRRLLKVIHHSTTRNSVLVIFTIQLLITIMWGTIALFGKHLFGFAGKEIGYISAFAAAVGIFSQTVILKHLTSAFKERTIVISAVLGMGLGLICLAFSNNLGMLLLGVGLLAASFNIGMPTAMGLVSKLSAENEQGNVMGTMSSVVSFGSVVGPILGNAIFSISMRGNYVLASGLALVIAIISLKQIREPKSSAI